MHTDNATEMPHLKARIAEVYGQRERLKQALEAGALTPRAGFLLLDATDHLLSELDTRYKTLWDATRQNRPRKPAP